MTKPRNALVDTAIGFARTWCSGHIIDGAPALVHAIRVARKAEEHEPIIRPELAAALILHDSPEYAAQDATIGSAEALYDLLTAKLNSDVARLVREITEEHEAARPRLPESPAIELAGVINVAIETTVPFPSVPRQLRQTIEFKLTSMHMSRVFTYTARSRWLRKISQITSTSPLLAWIASISR